MEPVKYFNSVKGDENVTPKMELSFWSDDDEDDVAEMLARYGKNDNHTLVNTRESDEVRMHHIVDNNLSSDKIKLVNDKKDHHAIVNDVLGVRSQNSNSPTKIKCNVTNLIDTRHQIDSAMDIILATPDASESEDLDSGFLSDTRVCSLKPKGSRLSLDTSELTSLSRPSQDESLRLNGLLFGRRGDEEEEGVYSENEVGKGEKKVRLQEKKHVGENERGVEATGIDILTHIQYHCREREQVSSIDDFQKEEGDSFGAGVVLGDSHDFGSDSEEDPSLRDEIHQVADDRESEEQENQSCRSPKSASNGSRNLRDPSSKEDDQAPLTIFPRDNHAISIPFVSVSDNKNLPVHTESIVMDVELVDSSSLDKEFLDPELLDSDFEYILSWDAAWIQQRERRILNVLYPPPSPCPLALFTPFPTLLSETHPATPLFLPSPLPPPPPLPLPSMGGVRVLVPDMASVQRRREGCVEERSEEERSEGGGTNNDNTTKGQKNKRDSLEMNEKGLKKAKTSERADEAEKADRVEGEELEIRSPDSWRDTSVREKCRHSLPTWPFGTWRVSPYLDSRSKDTSGSVTNLDASHAGCVLVSSAPILLQWKVGFMPCNAAMYSPSLICINSPSTFPSSSSSSLPPPPLPSCSSPSLSTSPSLLAYKTKTQQQAANVKDKKLSVVQRLFKAVTSSVQTNKVAMENFYLTSLASRTCRCTCIDEIVPRTDGLPLTDVASDLDDMTLKKPGLKPFLPMYLQAKSRIPHRVSYDHLMDPNHSFIHKSQALRSRALDAFETCMSSRNLIDSHQHQHSKVRPFLSCYVNNIIKEFKSIKFASYCRLKHVSYDHDSARDNNFVRHKGIENEMYGWLFVPHPKEILLVKGNRKGIRRMSEAKREEFDAVTLKALKSARAFSRMDPFSRMNLNPWRLIQSVGLGGKAVSSSAPPSHRLEADLTPLRATRALSLLSLTPIISLFDILSQLDVLHDVRRRLGIPSVLEMVELEEVTNVVVEAFVPSSIKPHDYDPTTDVIKSRDFITNASSMQVKLPLLGNTQLMKSPQNELEKKCSPPLSVSVLSRLTHHIEGRRRDEEMEREWQRNEALVAKKQLGEEKQGTRQGKGGEGGKKSTRTPRSVVRISKSDIIMQGLLKRKKMGRGTITNV
eukprot:CAMPEP_0175063500 /NCGR_PEP_ID=MMETSP0052_2-20121109/14793_1 /TAXON_ID=51329 ORGANISM="Polytomella parva, Strain SAG 63-3" /NCGR_SAMPLE_ID=MMETSP0052_2 /ASSEMBLY_ACC=CAM_ASM_000194 /LENGTH=1145 /DNA_ID=CAMNT_0016329709 /DNA_START=126 /DNA_END=3564 /DNA_ORIENTATION=-